MGQLLRVTAQKGKDLLHHIGRGIYPPLCLSCSAETDTAGLCSSCWSDTNSLQGTHAIAVVRRCWVILMMCRVTIVCDNLKRCLMGVQLRYIQVVRVVCAGAETC